MKIAEINMEKAEEGIVRVICPHCLLVIEMQMVFLEAVAPLAWRDLCGWCEQRLLFVCPEIATTDFCIDCGRAEEDCLCDD